jgi:hypothetical protein
MVTLDVAILHLPTVGEARIGSFRHLFALRNAGESKFQCVDECVDKLKRATSWWP